MNSTNFKCECGRCFEIKKALGNHRAKCEIYKTHLDDLLTIDFYNYHYFELDKSLRTIAVELNLPKRVILNYLKIRGFKKKTLSEQRNSQSTKNKKRDTNLKRHGKEKFTNRQKSNQTHIDRYGGVGFQVKELADKTKSTLLERYGVDNCAKSKTLQENRKNTCLDKYGFVTNLLNPDCILKIKDTKFKLYGDENYSNRQKFKETCLEKYGVDNPNKSPIVQAKSEQTCLLKYGVPHIGSHLPTIEKVKETKRKNGTFLIKYSKISQEMFWGIYFNLINTNRIYFAQLNTEFTVCCPHNKINYFYDFVDNNTKRVIEYNGNLFHANPSMYKENDTPNPYDKNRTAKEIWEYDAVKLNFIKSLGYDVLIVWDHEYLNNKSATIDLCVEFLTKN